MELVEGEILFGISITRRRVMDRVTERRETRDWVTAYGLLYEDGGNGTTLNLDTYRSLMQEVRKLPQVDDIVVYGRIATYQSTNVKFEQYGLRAHPEREATAAPAPGM